jgi:hypothetical protein
VEKEQPGQVQVPGLGGVVATQAVHEQMELPDAYLPKSTTGMRLTCDHEWSVVKITAMEPHIRICAKCGESGESTFN